MVFINDYYNFKIKINTKLNGYRTADKKIKLKHPEENKNLTIITSKDAIDMVNDLENDLCIECGCNMLFCNYEPWCVYQFSFDRINNNKIHSKNNLRIICFNCNSSGNNAPKMSCSKNCHKGCSLFEWNASDKVREISKMYREKHSL